MSHKKTTPVNTAPNYLYLHGMQYNRGSRTLNLFEMKLPNFAKKCFKTTQLWIFKSWRQQITLFNTAFTMSITVSSNPRVSMFCVEIRFLISLHCSFYLSRQVGQVTVQIWEVWSIVINIQRPITCSFKDFQIKFGNITGYLECIHSPATLILLYSIYKYTVTICCTKFTGVVFWRKRCSLKHNKS